MSDQLDQLCINTVRFLSVDAVQQANSGHPGMPLGAAAMAYVLWTRLLKHNPRNPDWFDCDRFVLSAGHGSMLLYSLLHLSGELPPDWDADIPVFPADAKGMATRVASGKVMNAIAPRLPALTGGSADLDPSTHTALEGFGDFHPPSGPDDNTQGADRSGWNYTGHNLHFGVREHAMGAIVNGLAVHGATIPYGSTFLIFSDYMRPPIRLAALMGLPVVYVFTHDSIALGEDGPTHQPVEQLATLRTIPNLTVIRPGDANETTVAWRVALETRDRPVVLVLSRQNLPTLDRDRYASADGLRRGAYLLSDAARGRGRGEPGVAPLRG